MKLQRIRAFAFVVTGAAVLAACNPLSKMAKRAGEVNYSITPNPVEYHADSVQITIEGSFPTKYFHPKIAIKVTPVMSYAAGETKMDPVTLVGEQNEADGIKIPYEKGGSFSHTTKVKYVEGMRVSTLKVIPAGIFKGKETEYEAIKVGDGTITTPLLLQDEDWPILGNDAFTKQVPVKFDADIHYVVNKSNVRPTELAMEDIKALKAWVKNGLADRYEFKNLQNVAYASPEGEISLNENLANERAESGANAVATILKKEKIEAASAADFYSNVGKGEDWDGFKSLMTASDIKDKDLILRVLEMYTDLNKREQEIKNLAATYKEVDNKILPQLRRTMMTLNAIKMSRSDEEIKNLVKTTPEVLGIEEILYAATLTDDLNEKIEIYKTAAKVVPGDWRGQNNVGVILIKQAKLDEAKVELDKAAQAFPDNKAIKNNLGVIERMKGNIEGAIELYTAAEGAGKEVMANMGLIKILQADYAAATSLYNGVYSFNAALAYVLNGNPQGGEKTLDSMDDKGAALWSYLKAIIGAKMGNNEMLIENLKEAVKRDPKLAAYAKDDAEFLKYKENADFQGVIN